MQNTGPISVSVSAAMNRPCGSSESPTASTADHGRLLQSRTFRRPTAARYPQSDPAVSVNPSSERKSAYVSVRQTMSAPWARMRSRRTCPPTERRVAHSRFQVWTRAVRSMFILAVAASCADRLGGSLESDARSSYIESAPRRARAEAVLRVARRSSSRRSHARMLALEIAPHHFDSLALPRRGEAKAVGGGLPDHDPNRALEEHRPSEGRGPGSGPRVRPSGRGASGSGPRVRPSGRGAPGSGPRVRPSGRGASGSGPRVRPSVWRTLGAGPDPVAAIDQVAVVAPPAASSSAAARGAAVRASRSAARLPRGETCQQRIDQGGILFVRVIEDAERVRTDRVQEASSGSPNIGDGRPGGAWRQRSTGALATIEVKPAQRPKWPPITRRPPRIARFPMPVTSTSKFGPNPRKK